MRKNAAQKFGKRRQFSKNWPKKMIDKKAKIRQIWSPWLLIYSASQVFHSAAHRSNWRLEAKTWFLGRKKFRWKVALQFKSPEPDETIIL
jgi:hypothetical protein